MAIATVGTAGTYATLTLFESALQGTHGATETARLISNIIDSVTFAGWGVCTITIKGNLAGYNKRKLSSGISGAHTLRIGDADITPIIEDLELDGAAQTGNGGIYLGGYTGTAIVRRVKIYSSNAHGMLIDAGAVAIENVIIFSAGARGISIGAGVTANIKNTGVFESVSAGFRWPANATAVNCFNCWSMKNGADDFIDDAAGGGQTPVLLEECVDSDGTGAVVEALKTITGGASNKIDYAGYFADPENASIPARDFRLNDSDQALWGIDGHAPQTPADDFSGITRVGDDIGPHDLLSVCRPTRLCRDPLRCVIFDPFQRVVA